MKSKNVFATSHGKGAIDGIAANVKRLVWNATQACAFVNNAQSFAVEAANQVHGTNDINVSSEEVIYA